MKSKSLVTHGRLSPASTVSSGAGTNPDQPGLLTAVHLCEMVCACVCVCVCVCARACVCARMHVHICL